VSSQADSGFSRVILALSAISLLILVTGIGIGLLASGAGFAVGTPLSSGDNTNNIQQQNPADISEEGALSSVERQLADRAAQRVQSGAVNISNEEYERARESLTDEQYQALFDRYSEVASETGNQNRSELLSTLPENQAEYATAAEEYRTLHALLTGTADLSDAENRSAAAELSVVNGTQLNGTVGRLLIQGTPNETLLAQEVLDWNRTEQSRVARELDDRWRRVNQTGSTLTRNYQQLAETGPDDYSDAIRSIRDDQAEIKASQEEVRDKYLTEVTLKASAQDTLGSFTDPISIVGRLSTTNGTAIANEPVRLQIENQTYHTRTSGQGRFVVAYRPTTISANTTNITVRFEPDPNSRYTAATTNVSVTIDQVRPNISVAVHPATVRFNETLTVFGRVGRANAGAGNVPYLVTIDGEFLARGTTARNGTLKTELRVPASVMSDDAEVKVRLPVQERALAPANGTTTVRVTETATRLSMVAERTEGRSIRVTGTLSTTDNGTIANQDVQIEVNGTTLGTVTTGSNGQFATTVIVPEDVLNSGYFGGSTPLNVRATFDGSTTSLETATASTVITANVQGAGRWLLGVVGLGIALLVGYVGYRRWRPFERDGSPEVDSVDEPTLTASDGDQRDTTLFKTARDQLSAGRPDMAVQFSYAAIRRQYEDAVGQHPSATHWEFYRICQEQLEDTETIEFLRQTTELYEQAVYASEAVSEDAVSRLLKELNRSNRSVSGSTPSDD